MPWIAFSLGLAIGAFVGIFAIGLLSMARCSECRDSKGVAYDLTHPNPHELTYRGSEGTTE